MGTYYAKGWLVLFEGRARVFIRGYHSTMVSAVVSSTGGHVQNRLVSP